MLLECRAEILSAQHVYHKYYKSKKIPKAIAYNLFYFYFAKKNNWGYNEIYIKRWSYSNTT